MTPDKTVTAIKSAKDPRRGDDRRDSGLCFTPDNALWRMHLIVRAMVRRRMVKRCCRIVKNARRPTLLESLRLLARQRFNPKHVDELSWEDLQERVTQWRQFVRVAIVVLLASERRICERVFNAPEAQHLSVPLRPFLRGVASPLGSSLSLSILPLPAPLQLQSMYQCCARCSLVLRATFWPASSAIPVSKWAASVPPSVLSLVLCCSLLPA